MKVKVQCPCGSRFEFEVEPVGGHMPVAINCPTCGADATGLANVVIEQQLAAVNPPGLTISTSSHAAPSEAPPETEFCSRHKSEPIVEACRVCNRPICAQCMEQFGYVCSVYCRQQAAQKKMAIPVYGRQKSVVAGRSSALMALVAYAGVALVLAALGFWVWYAWFAREPKIVYSLPIPKRDVNPNRPFRADEYYQLIGPGELLSVKSKHAGLFDIAQQRQLWSTPLETEAEESAATAARAKKSGADANAFLPEENYDLSNPLVVVTANDVWLAFRDRLLRLDRQTGQRKDTSVSGRILNFLSSDDALLVVSISPETGRTLSRISLPDGAIQTTNLPSPGELKPVTRVLAQKNLVNPNLSKLPPVANDAKLDRLMAASAAITRSLKTGTQTNGNVIAPSGAPVDALDEMASYAINHEEIPPFVLAGTGVVEFQAKLLEKLTVAHEAMKPKKESILDSGNVNASQGLDLAQEMMNDANRKATGGVEIEDVSRFQVTLHRWFDNDAPDWVGEVVGPPKLYALKSVALLVAGQTLIVFDQHNKKLWEAKLTFPMHFLGDRAPCLETKDALYFADVGMLTRFDLATGNVRWRLDSVGISSIQADDRQALYLTSTTASPEQIMHPQQVNLRDKIHPVIMKVDPENGKVLWRLESVGTDCLLTGKFLYATRVTKVMAALRLEEGPDTHYDLNLLNRANGDTIWNYHKVNRLILKTEVQQNWILLQFDDEVRVMKFFTL